MQTNKQNTKEIYVTPSIEIIEMENEGVIAASTEGYEPMTRRSSTTTPTYNSASGSDLEDMINDILTVEN